MFAALAGLTGVATAHENDFPDGQRTVLSKTYPVHGNDRETTHTDSFELPAGIEKPFRLEAEAESSRRGRDRASARIRLNGAEIVSSSDFNRDGEVRRQVTLQPTNRIEVTVAGKPGDRVKVQIRGTPLRPRPVSLTPNPLSLADGAKADLTATISPAPATASTIRVKSSDPSVAGVPSHVAVAANHGTVVIPVRGKKPGNASVEVTLNDFSVSASVTVAPAGPKLIGLVPARASVAVGGSTELTVSISATQTKDTEVQLSARPQGIVWVPSAVTIPAGELSARFTVSGSAPGGAHVKASIKGSVAISRITVTPEAASIVSLLPPVTSLHVGAGASLAGTLSAAQARPVVIEVGTVPAGIVDVPAQVTVPAGATQFSVPITAVALGNTLVSASLNGLSASAAVEVTAPPPTLADLQPPLVNLTRAATASVTVTISAAQVNPTEVQLAVDAPGIVQAPAAVIVPPGATTAAIPVSGVADGRALLTASLNGSSRSVAVVVVAPPAAVTSIVPAALPLQQGAVGTMTVNIDSAQTTPIAIALASDLPAVAQVPESVTVPAGSTSASFPVDGVAPGSATIKANANGTTASAQVTVTEPLPELAGMAPPTLTLAKGRAGSLTLTATRAPTLPATITITSSQPTFVGVPSVVTLPAGALTVELPLTTLGEGEATVTATLNGTSVSTIVTVTPPALDQITVTPASPTAFVGESIPFKAEGSFSDGSQNDITTTVAWTSSAPAVAEIAACGLATALAPGQTTITATQDGITASTTLTVDAVVLPGLSIAPQAANVQAGESLVLTVVSEQPAPAGGLVVALVASGTGSVGLPPSVTIPAAQTSATVSVAGLTTGSITVTASAALYRPASATINIVAAPPPVIASVSPGQGAPGSRVTISGSGFSATAGNNRVTIGGTLAGVLTAQANQLVATVPLAAASGPVSVTVRGVTATGPNFTVQRAQSVSLVASPAELRTVAGAATALSVQLGSGGTAPFTGIAELSAADLPPGVTTSFSPPALSAGQAGTVRLDVPAGTPAGSFQARILATGAVGGATQTLSAPFTLVVQPVGNVTGVRGRFVDIQGRGIAGVIVRGEDPAVAGSNLGEVVSDAAGNFLLTGLAAGNLTLRMDATPANPTFPIWPHSVAVAAGQVTPLTDWVIQPAPKDELFRPLIANHSQDQIFTNPEVPGLSARVPAGVTIVGWDQQVKTRVAVEKIDPDKLPTEAAPLGAKSYFRVHFGTPMGGVPTVAGGGAAGVFVTAPNDLGLAPGEKADLYNYFGTPLGGEGGWRKAGTGTVSADGRTIVADPDSGITRFCGVCGLNCFSRSWANPSPPCPECDGKGPPQKDGVNPVTLSMGMELSTTVDMVIDGVMPITIGRSYYPWDPFIRRAALVPSLGRQWIFSYDWIVYSAPGTGELRMVIPGNAQGLVFTSDGAGAFEAPSDLRFGGAKLRFDSGSNAWRLTFKDGRQWVFSPTIQFVDRTLYFLSSQGDANGNVLRIERNGSGRPTTITAPGKTVSIGIGSSGFIEVVRDATGRQVRYEYADSRLTKVTAPDDGVTSYTYRFPPPPITAVVSGGAGSGGATQIASSSFANRDDGPVYISSISRPGTADPIVLDYGQSQRVLRQLVGGPAPGVFGPPPLKEIRFAYELNGTCAKRGQFAPGGCAGANGPTEDSYENREAGWLFFGGEVVATRVYDANGNGYKVRFNAAGLGTELIDADGQSTRFERDSRNRITKVTDPLGRATQYAYDSNSNITQIVDAAGRATDLGYHPKWNKVTSIASKLADGAPVAYRFEYEESDFSAGKLLRAIDPLGNITSYAYTDAGDAKGLVQSVTDPLGNVTTLAYDARADLTVVSDALGNSVDFLRDAVGRLRQVTDAMGASTASEYNTLDQITRIVDANGGITAFTYDPKRDPTSVIDPLGRAVESYLTDDVHRLVRRTDAKGGVETYTYDTASRLLSATDRKGQAVSLGYDRQNRVTRIAYADGKVETRDYDAVGRITRIQDAAGTIAFDYDDLDRVLRETTEVDGLVNTVEYEYDALDRRVKRTVNGADPTTYAYDLASRLTAIGFRGRTVGYEWDAASRLTAKVLPNGIRQEYAYDAAGRLLRIAFSKTDASLIDSIAYTYDPNGRRTSKTTNLPSNDETPITGTYDEANRMTSVTFPATGETCTLAYDANGNLASKTCPSGTTTYTWDVRDRLTAIAGPGVTAGFKYDALGRRVQRVVNGQPTGYLYDGVQALAEFGANDAALLTGLAIDEAIGRFAGSGDRTLLTDALGSVVAETRADQTLATTYGYSPYGETVRGGEESGNSNQYTGRENDGTGLYFYRARYVEPELKRFIAEDPLFPLSGTNAYSYADGDPVNARDPLGLATIIDRSIDWYWDQANKQADAGNAVGAISLGIAAVLVESGVVASYFAGKGAIVTGWKVVRAANKFSDPCKSFGDALLDFGLDMGLGYAFKGGLDLLKTRWLAVRLVPIKGPGHRVRAIAERIYNENLVAAEILDYSRKSYKAGKTILKRLSRQLDCECNR